MSNIFTKSLSGNDADYSHDGGVIAAIFIALLSFIFTCCINGFASTGPNKIFRQSTARISDENPTEFTPAGPTFSLWGLIYSWQLAFLAYSIVNIWRTTSIGYLYNHPYTLHVAIFVLFIVNMLLNALWLFLWDRLKFGLSTIVIYAMLATIVAATVLDHVFLWNNRWDYIQLDKTSDIWIMRFIVLNGHAVYSAWLLVAASLNFTIWLKKKLPLNGEGWATTISLIFVAIGICVYWILENFVFPSQMAYTWSPWLVWLVALIGILAKHWRLLKEKSLNQILIVIISVLCVILFSVKIILFAVRYTRQEIPTGDHPAGF
ncbi:unnamed protein product [Adineta ricciae]|uniref:Uncharacterized protein n=1 Tax=Adineta ricciae TaxID=249248 RepID=A0A815DI31_ADIRI|nr:unnamed protein product [Adineta ricciae]CAF1512998.1 unnamed protein product [Adineta ricciae]